jgi:TIR domain
LTLKQFSLPWSGGWDGTKTSYIHTMLENAPDQTLMDLARHVGVHSDEAPGSAPQPTFWAKGMLWVFISHVGAHRAAAAALQQALLRFGVSCFVAHNDIEPTLEWQNEIENALATCDACDH